MSSKKQGQPHWLRHVIFSTLVAVTLSCSWAPKIELTAHRYTQLREKGHARLAALAEKIRDVFDQEVFAPARWGVYIRSYDTREVVFRRNETEAFAPASNEKLFTTVGALMGLGPDYRYATQFYSTGELLPDGRLKGNLIVRGNGDFWLGAHRPERDLKAQLAQLADQCRQAGIVEIQGDLIGDDTWMDPKVDWRHRRGSLVMNQHQLDVILRYGSQEPEIIPEAPGVEVIDRVDRVGAEVDSSSYLRLQRVPEDSTNTLGGGEAFYLTGIIKPGDTLSTSIRLHMDQAQFYLEALKVAFEKAGITIRGTIRIFREPDEEYQALFQRATFRFQRLSPPMSELAKLVNKPSDNYRAERLFLTVGQQFEGVANQPNAEKAIKELLLKFGIRPEFYHLADGSGGRANQVRPIDIVDMLDAMRESSYFQVFYESLPIAGVDGTLDDRMQDTPAEGNVHAKTGHIPGVTALSGYVTSRDGERFTFSMIINDNPVSSSVPDSAENEVCALLAGFSRW